MPMIRYLYIFDLQRPYPSTLDKKRLKSIVGNKCHPVDIYIEEERLSVRWNWLELPNNNSDNAQLNYKNIYLSTVRIWSSRTRTHDTDLLPKCFTCQTQQTQIETKLMNRFPHLFVAISTSRLLTSADNHHQDGNWRIFSSFIFFCVKKFWLKYLAYLAG